jgi:DNA-binding beta-propeller fold protein YncE
VLLANDGHTMTNDAGLGATQVRVSPDGTLALIANRAEGTVSIFTVKDKQLTPAGKLGWIPATRPRCRVRWPS